MWEKCIDYLKDPYLVISVQRYFGVIYDLELLKNGPNRNNKSTCTGQITRHTHSNHTLDKSQTKDLCNDSVSSTISTETELSSDSDCTKEKENFIVKNKFWYYFFLIGTALGDEIFYATFIPFWFWNIDGAVGRRVVLVWTVLMYIGQGIKDVIRWPRPGPPVQKLQKKWAIEYGLPSTHAMVGLSIPFSVLLYTYNRYQYPLEWGIIMSVSWCTVICLSRIYLGMHSVLDIVAGLLLAFILMLVLIPLVDVLDAFWLTNIFSPFIILIVSILAIVYYPNSDKWTPTRGDTTMVVSVCAGIHIGAWINYQLGHMEVSDLTPPYKIIWPSVEMLGMTILRTILGFCGVLATRAIAKSVSYAFVCALLGRDKNELRNSPNSLINKDKVIVELSYKYFTCGMIGLNTLYFFPNVFVLLGINRPTFYTEI